MHYYTLYYYSMQAKALAWCWMPGGSDDAPAAATRWTTIEILINSNVNNSMISNDTHIPTYIMYTYNSST